MCSSDMFLGLIAILFPPIAGKNTPPPGSLVDTRLDVRSCESFPKLMDD